MRTIKRKGNTLMQLRKNYKKIADNAQQSTVNSQQAALNLFEKLNEFEKKEYFERLLKEYPSLKSTSEYMQSP